MQCLLPSLLAGGRAPRLGGAIVAAWVCGCASAPIATDVAVLPDQRAPRGDAEIYELTPENTTVEATITAVGSFTLQLAVERGNLWVTPESLPDSAIELTLDMASASSSPEVVAEIARERFLDVNEHPSAHFTSRTITPRVNAFTVVGLLELNGVARGLEVPAELAIDGCRARAEVAFSIDRRDFDIVDEGSLDGAVSDEVEVRIAIEVARHGAPADCHRTER